ncbi:MAG: hypothetical protein AB1749_08070 [Pseudomonadota bacterium]
MYQKLLAIFSISLLLAFLGVLAIWVREIDIKIVLAITGALALYDFWLEAFRGNGK